MGRGAAEGQGGIAADTYTRERTLGRGFLAGMMWGALVGVISIALASQLTDRREVASAPRAALPAADEVAMEVVDSVEPEPEAAPEPEPEAPADAVEVGDAASGEGAAPPAPEATTEITIEPDPAVLAAPPVAPAEPVAPAGSPVVAMERDVPASGPVPDRAAGAPAAPTAAEQPTPAPQVAPPPQVSAPSAPTRAADPPVSGTSAGDVVVRAAPDAAVRQMAPQAVLPGVAAPPPSVPAEDVRTPLAPTAMAETEVPAAPPAAPRGAASVPVPARPLADTPPSMAQADPATRPAAPSAGIAAAPEVPEAPAVRVPAPGFQGAEGVRVNRLPTIGGAEPAPGATAEAIEAEAGPDDAGPDAGSGATQPAMLRHAVAFDTPADQPLIAVILMHGGAAAPGEQTGANLPIPVSFAVNAGTAGAREIAAAYRAAGREVLLVPTLPPGATPSDVEVALSVNFDTIPEAVALMDAPEGGFQSEREAVAQVVAAVTATGHGLVTFPRGLNTAQQLADRAGVPARSVFRVLEDGNGDAVLRTLDQAAFRARQEGVVILVGQAEPATVAALRRWVEANPNRQVAFAPVSAALTAE